MRLQDKIFNTQGKLHNKLPFTLFHNALVYFVKYNGMPRDDKITLL